MCVFTYRHALLDEMQVHPPEILLDASTRNERRRRELYAFNRQNGDT